jgi:hypothetical protein
VFGSPTVLETFSKMTGLSRILQKFKFTVCIGKDWPFGSDIPIVTTEGPSVTAVDYTASYGVTPCKTEI